MSEHGLRYAVYEVSTDGLLKHPKFNEGYGYAASNASALWRPPMSDPRFPRAHLTERNRRYPEGGWLLFAAVVGFGVWVSLALVLMASLRGGW